MERSYHRAQRFILLAVVLLWVSGCRGAEEPAASSPPSEAAPAQEASPSPVSPARALFASSGLNLEKGPQLDDAQLKQTGAKSQERFISEDPGLDILLLGYENPTAAATALPTTASWVNRSKTLHKAEAMAEGDYVLLVGLKPGAEPTKDSKSIVDKLFNLYVGAASKL